jgi:SAM-dependent methyltransferase
VVCECAFCTFPDKAQAAAEFARVLRPDGRVGLSDLTRSGELPPELESLLAWIACIADARPVEEYGALLESAGFTGRFVENHDEALTQMVRDIRQRLLAAELLARLGTMELPFVDFEQAKSMAKVAAEAVRTGRLGYSLVTASR